MPPKRRQREEPERNMEVMDEEEEEEEEETQPAIIGRPPIPGARAPNGRLQRSVSWVGTVRDANWVPSANLITRDGIQYLTGQLEQGANQRLPQPVGRWQNNNIMPDHQHYQIYIETVNPVTEQELRALLGVHCAWLAVRRSTDRDDAIEYTRKKDGTERGEPFEYGTQRPADAPREYRQCINDLKNGATFTQLCQHHTGVVARCAGGMMRVEAHLNPSPVIRPVETFIYWGPPGSGKTSRVMIETAGNVYVKNNGKWWDGYEREDCVCLDDFTGDLGQDTDRANMEFFKRITDIYGMRVQTKGGHVPAHWKKIYITSNVPMEMWWPEFRRRNPVEHRTHMDAIMRRIPSEKRIFIGDPNDERIPEQARFFISTVPEPHKVPFEQLMQLLAQKQEKEKTVEA